MSTFTDALSAYIAAEREWAFFQDTAELFQAEPTATLQAATDAAAERLAQAGDSLESEVRRMIREEMRHVDV